MAQKPNKRPPTPTVLPEWATPIHFVTSTKCGHARKGERLTRDAEKVSCRECLMAINVEKQSKRSG